MMISSPIVINSEKIIASNVWTPIPTVTTVTTVTTDTSKNIRIEGVNETANALKGIQQNCINQSSLTRIGSNSSNAQVFQIDCGQNIRGAAMKIMPITKDSIKKDNKNEIDIAIKMSNLVITGKSSHFPIVFATGYCDHIILSDNLYENRFKINERLKLIKSKYDKITELADNHNLLRHRDPYYPENIIDFKLDLTKDLTGKENLYSQLESTGHSLETIIEFLDGHLENELCDINALKLKGDLLYSELADMDLKQFLEKFNTNITFDKLFKIYINVIDGIIAMQSIGYVHKDLHLGNVLLLIDKKDKNDIINDWGIVSLLHDFGGTQKYTHVDLINNQFVDIKNFTIHFMNSIIKNVAKEKKEEDIYDEFKKKILSILSPTELTKNEYTMNILKENLQKTLLPELKSKLENPTVLQQNTCAKKQIGGLNTCDNRRCELQMINYNDLHMINKYNYKNIKEYHE